VTFAERFWEKVQKVDGDACWEWTGAKYANGYGEFSVRRSVAKPAHRVAWALTHGSIPDGFWVLHRCDNRKCVRPDHLFLGTAQDNSDDMWAKNRQPLRRQSHCRMGHPLNGDNVYTYQARGRVKRKCRICWDAWKRAKREERIAERAAKPDVCRAGHPWTLETTYRYRGYRLCRVCRRQRFLESVARRRKVSPSETPSL
jgi:hypothetical protein